jgi:L-fucose mutarotase
LLKGIDPLLGPQLLAVLCDMGHGDEIAVVDANFTARKLAGTKPVLRLDGVGLLRACQAVTSVFPLDAFVTQPVGYMQVSGAPAGHMADVHREVLDHLHQHGIATPEQCEGIERFAFYDRVATAHAFLVTGELRPYGNFLFKKGVLTAVDLPGPSSVRP